MNYLISAATFVLFLTNHVQPGAAGPDILALGDLQLELSIDIDSYLEAIYCVATKQNEDDCHQLQRPEPVVREKPVEEQQVKETVFTPDQMLAIVKDTTNLIRRMDPMTVTEDEVDLVDDQGDLLSQIHRYLRTDEAIVDDLTNTHTNFTVYVEECHHESGVLQDAVNKILLDVVTDAALEAWAIILIVLGSIAVFVIIVVVVLICCGCITCCACCGMCSCCCCKKKDHYQSNVYV